MKFANRMDRFGEGVFSMLAQMVRKQQTGYVRTYALAVLEGVEAVLAYLATAGLR